MRKRGNYHGKRNDFFSSSQRQFSSRISFYTVALIRSELVSLKFIYASSQFPVSFLYSQQPRNDIGLPTFPTNRWTSRSLLVTSRYQIKKKHDTRNPDDNVAYCFDFVYMARKPFRIITRRRNFFKKLRSAGINWCLFVTADITIFRIGKQGDAT